MCIVGVKVKGVNFPTKSEIENCLFNNPDGFAMAWNEDKKIHTYKSMDEKKFIKKYMAVAERCDAEKTAMIIHARIATHGSTGIKNCHCWEGCGFAFAHNGVLSIGNRDDMTDSETFFRDIFTPIFKQGGWSAATKAIKAIIGTSKFAFINADGDIYMFGTYVKQEKDGKNMFWSNNTYSYGSYAKSGLGGYYGSLYGGYGYGYGYGNKYKGSGYGTSAYLRDYVDEFDWEEIESQEKKKEVKCIDIDWAKKFEELGL